MKKVSLAALLVVFALNFQATHPFFERFNYNKGYEDGYLQAYRLFSKPDDAVPFLIASMIGLCVGMYVVESVSDYYIANPTNILQTIGLLQTELHELKLVLTNQNSLETSFLKEYVFADNLSRMSHFNNAFPDLKRNSRLLLIQILHAIKTIITPLPDVSSANLIVTRHELYHLVNELYLSLAQDLPNNDLGNQIKTQLQLDDDIAAFLLA